MICLSGSEKWEWRKSFVEFGEVYRMEIQMQTIRLWVMSFVLNWIE